MDKIDIVPEEIVEEDIPHIFPGDVYLYCSKFVSLSLN